MFVFEERAPSRPTWECLRETRRRRQSTDRLVAEENEERFGANLSGDLGRLKGS